MNSTTIHYWHNNYNN